MPYCKDSNGVVSFEIGTSCPVGMSRVSTSEGQAAVAEANKAAEAVELQQSAYRQWDKLPMYGVTDGAYYGSTTTGDSPMSRQLYETTAAEFVDIPAQLWGADPKEFGSLSKTLNNIPGFDNDGSVEDVTGKFEDFLEMTSRSGLQMSPFEALNYFEQVAKMQGYKGPGGGGGGATTRTIVNLTNKFDAEVLVNTALNNYLGRDASEDEIREFWKQLNKGERKNPTISGPSGTKGGFNSSLASEKYAETRDDYAETTADVTLKGLMENAIRGRMSGTLEGML